jgi:hypothetical protein
VHVVRLRVWLPDRPGALGAVASRIGSVKGDVIGIEILEQGAGRAIDDLVVALPDASLVDLLVSEVGEVDGVDVEEVTSLGSEGYDPDLDALEAAAALVAVEDRDVLVSKLCRQIDRGTNASWSCVIDLEQPAILASNGDVPAFDWLHAFVLGSRSSELVAAGHAGPDDVLSAALGEWGAVVIGRDGHPFRARERRRLTALARIVEVRLSQLNHPGPERPFRADKQPGGDHR